MGVKEFKKSIVTLSLYPGILIKSFESTAPFVD
jgi:hypothetical protein